VAYHVGAGKVPNRWPPEKFAELINAIGREMNAATILVSGPMDEEPVEEVSKRLDVSYYVFAKQHIRVVASCIACVNLLVSNDTGIMHVGAATGVPVLSLFGPTDPTQWAPTGPLHRYIHSSSGNIADIQVGEVASIAREMLRSTGARERVAVKQ
jgi:heptosyltransferase-2